MLRKGASTLSAGVLAVAVGVAINLISDSFGKSAVPVPGRTSPSSGDSAGVRIISAEVGGTNADPWIQLVVSNSSTDASLVTFAEVTYVGADCHDTSNLLDPGHKYKAPSSGPYYQGGAPNFGDLKDLKPGQWLTIPTREKIPGHDVAGFRIDISTVADHFDVRPCPSIGAWVSKFKVRIYHDEDRTPIYAPNALLVVAYK